MRTCALVKVRASPTAHNSPHSIRKTCTGWVKKIICIFSVFILLYESLLFISSFSLSNLLRFYLICKCNKVNADWSLLHFKLQHWQHPTITPMKNKNCHKGFFSLNTTDFQASNDHTRSRTTCTFSYKSQTMQRTHSRACIVRQVWKTLQRKCACECM